MTSWTINTITQGMADALERLMSEYQTTQDPERAIYCRIARARVHIAQLYGELDRIPEAMENIEEAEKIIKELIA